MTVEFKIIDDPLPPPQITDDMRRQIHETDDFQLCYELTLAYQYILTNPTERAFYLEWLERNDVLFAMIKRNVSSETGDVANEELLKAIAIVQARCLRIAMTKGGAT